MKITGILSTAGAAVLFATANVHAATIASYPFTGSSLASTDLDPASVASDIALGSGLTDTTRFAVANGNPAPSMRINTDETDGTTFATAVTANDYFSFSVTPSAGDFLTLDTLSFDLAVNSALISSNVQVQLSATGTTYVPLGTVSSFSTTTFTTESFSLAAADATLTAGLPIYVRFVVYDNANNANGYTAFDNISVTGASAALVPEPGTYTLLALGTMGMAGLILRRRQTTA